MEPLYIVTERFPSEGNRQAWSDYLRWSGLKLTELVSLDSMLCPSVLSEITEGDWDHIVNQDNMLKYFTELDYLVSRVGHLRGRNLLGVYRNPGTHPMAPVASKFKFVFEGYDLVEVDGGPSALTNCRGFPAALMWNSHPTDCCHPWRGQVRSRLRYDNTIPQSRTRPAMFGRSTAPSRSDLAWQADDHLPRSARSVARH
jgi:hypothetical protein